MQLSKDTVPRGSVVGLFYIKENGHEMLPRNDGRLQMREAKKDEEKLPIPEPEPLTSLVAEMQSRASSSSSDTLRGHHQM